MRFPGIQIDDELNLEDHTSYICKKITKCASIIHRARI